MLADRGEWEAAAELCHQLLEQVGLNAGGHFYYALLLEQAGRATEAEQRLRRAIYLDRRFTLARYHFGLFLRKTRQPPRSAVHAFENVWGLFADHPDGYRFPGGDGITMDNPTVVLMLTSRETKEDMTRGLKPAPTTSSENRTTWPS
jgi:tetratricopeptide (TPR) repeat protein